MNSLVFSGFLILLYGIGVMLLRRHLHPETSQRPRRVFLPWLASISWGVAPIIILNSGLAGSSALAVILASINFFTFVLIGPMMIFRRVTAPR